MKYKEITCGSRQIFSHNKVLLRLGQEGERRDGGVVPLLSYRNFSNVLVLESWARLLFLLCKVCWKIIPSNAEN